MFSLAKTLIISLLLTFTAYAPSRDVSSKTISEATQSCVKLEISTDNKDWGHGTAFFYKDLHTLVTARHCVTPTDLDGTHQTEKYPYLRVDIGNEHFPINNAKVTFSDKYDVAFIKIDISTINKYHYKPISGLSTVIPKVGDTVVGCGFPTFYNKVFVEGIISGEIKISYFNNNFYQITTDAINPGHSGSACLNSKGDLVGIFVAGDPNYPSTSVIVEENQLREQFNIWKI